MDAETKADGASESGKDQAKGESMKLRPIQIYSYSGGMMNKGETRRTLRRLKLRNRRRRIARLERAKIQRWFKVNFTETFRIGNLQMSEFPIMLNCQERAKYPECPHSVPWELVLPHENQADVNHYQTLKRLSERGGLDPTEFWAVMTDERYDARVRSLADGVVFTIKALKDFQK